MPEALAEIYVRAGSRVAEVVMNPFCGTGTTRVVAVKLARKFTGINLLRQCAEESRHRLRGVALACPG
jgi:site-specific DNA-methyltransferase (adenine-specific)